MRNPKTKKDVAILDILFKQPKDGEKDHIVVKCRVISPELSDLLGQIEDADKALVAYAEEEIYRIKPSDVYYIEAIDKKIFLYCENVVYESKQKLYEFEEMLNLTAFMRISRSAIVNISKVKSMSVALYGRLEVILKNDERVIVTRSYVDAFRSRLSL